VRLKLTLAYLGVRFSGWQVQPGLRTVQGCLEQAFERLCDKPTRVQGAGRTDAGVHALGQVAHADVDASRAIPWRKALNALLPKDICVIEAIPAPEGFHARYSARGKIYSYTLWTETGFVLPQRRIFVWPTGPLDCAAMDEAASILLGAHDFAGFQNVGTEVKTTVRTMASITRQPGPTPCEMVFRLQADGFLKQMVRNIMGCLVQAGRGKVSPDVVRSILDEGDRKGAYACAPPQGLTLERVFYPDENEAVRERRGSEHSLDPGRPGPELHTDDAESP
jgi:tRNA pseudouridine38-40 synthase